MNHFLSAREAKEFLVSRIVEEARRENVPLSEIERKMLYFSETFWTLPDIMDVNDQFEREYDDREYEEKIAELIRNAHKHDLSEAGDWGDLWSDASGTLAKEDHYILVMVGQAGIRVPNTAIPARPPGDLAKLWLTGIALVGVLLIGVFLFDEYTFDWNKWFWPIVAAVVMLYGLTLIFVGKKRLDRLCGKVFDWIFGVPKDLIANGGSNQRRDPDL